MAKTTDKTIYISVSEPENRKARIEIDGTIGGWDDEWNPKNRGCDIRRELDAISALDVDEIEVVISSLGGSADHAFQIHDALKQHKCKITTIVTGLCASGGTIIACAGDVRKISPNSLYLVHKCWSSTIGNSNELKKDMEMMDKIDSAMLNIYKSVSTKTDEEILALMNEQNGNGIWLTAQEALDYGFATELLENEEEDGDRSQARAKRIGIMASVLNKARSIRQPKTVIEKVSTLAPGTIGNNTGNNIINSQNQTQMKKILATFAILSAVLAIGAEQEFDETKGLTLSAEQLGKVEDELKALRGKADQLAKAQEDLTKAQQELKAAQEKAESDGKAIETLTAERDSYKAKYEAKPAAVQTPAASDPMEGTESEELKAMYAALEKEY